VARLKIGERKDWSGGFARWDGSAWTYYIRCRDARLGREPDGRAKQARISTGAHSEEFADLHLREFERNPLAYDPSRVIVGRAPLPFTEQICVEYLDYLAAPVGDGGKGDSPGHCKTVRSSMNWWLKQLGPVNLRALTVDELRSQIPVSDVRGPDGARVQKAPKGRKHKIVAIKHLVTWLRRTRGDGLLQGEGPDTSTLTVPQARGHKHHDPKVARQRQQKGKRALDGYPELRKHLASQKRWAWAIHALDLQADTGWHTTEVERWVTFGGLANTMPPGREKEAAGLLVTVQKSGNWYQTPVSRHGLEAARGLFAWASARHGRTHKGWDPVSKEVRRFKSKLFPRQQYERLCTRLCEKHGVPKFGPGHLRHALATMNSGQGFPAPLIGDFLGHTKEQQGELVRTTYADPGAQIRSVQPLVRPVPARLPSPLEKLMANEPLTEEKKKGGRPTTITNMPPASA
jgi:hypothetical protein